MTTEPEELADRLETIAEQLSDMGIEVLREALEDATEMPPEQAKREKQIARARNAALKAANLLRSLP